ncbi:phosphoserine transaminase (plasmid) [Rhizobium lusitanum]|uniref:phosphoserine transaminase n=1 Tax=Rhizobium lusitanum TaxID=293958 RepID=UPI0016082193|nr:phosphoserine transaminase [Rhizobium lusitanum]QND44714.1 phosphoserine transaminase [Rhizobium lusitanum]
MEEAVSSLVQCGQARLTKPTLKPARPYFSSGPCPKRPGWDATLLRDAYVGRSHRTMEGQTRLKQVIDLSRNVLRLPDDYLVAIVPGSDTGAVEMLLWNLLGQNGVEVCEWESFGRDWLHDIASELRVPGLKVYSAENFGEFPDLSAVDFDKDVVFSWNGTTSGVCVPDSDWIPDDRRGLTICDATSAVFCMEIDYRKLDAITWSWQKSLGGEGAHGMIALSPAAVKRLESYRPVRPVPKIFRLTKNGKLLHQVFEGYTINTPSMLAVEDALDALAWAESVGGLPGLLAKTGENFSVLKAWVDTSLDVEFLASNPRTISQSSVCLAFRHAANLPETLRRHFAQRVSEIVAHEEAGYDIQSYRDAPPGLRIWAGATVERSDLEALLPWIDWAIAEARAELSLNG